LVSPSSRYGAWRDEEPAPGGPDAESHLPQRPRGQLGRGGPFAAGRGPGATSAEGKRPLRWIQECSYLGRMPLQFGLWRIDEGVTALPASSLDNEQRLEEILEADPSILGLDELMLLGRQVLTTYGKRVDLLAMDVDGRLVVIELKRDRTPREVVAQAMDYGHWVRGLGTEDVMDLFAHHGSAGTFADAFRERFGQDAPEELNPDHRLIIVASSLDPATERIVEYASEYGMPLNVVFFQHFRDGDREYLARSWLIDPVEAEETTVRAPRPGRRGPRAPWNGQDFYVAFGEGEHDRRRWEDAVRYSFVSAGGRRWYSRTLEQLFVDSRVFVLIPKRGYVGVGIVTETAQPVADFKVEVDGRETPILDAPHLAANMGLGAEDPEQSEYLVRVNWVKTVPRDQAYWEAGMFANQNSATKLRQQFTLERLVERFELDRIDE
jgi:hypothetical protein